MHTRLRRGGREPDAGLATLEALFTIPVILLMIFGILQTAMWWYARQVALTAAQEGARAARAYDATDADGVAEATSYLSQVQGGSAPVLANSQVSMQRSANTVTVRVRGHVVSLVPGLSVSIDVTSTGPVEVFVPVNRS
jgi:Flp pilus assembly protein TadG